MSELMTPALPTGRLVDVGLFTYDHVRESTRAAQVYRRPRDPIIVLVMHLHDPPNCFVRDVVVVGASAGGIQAVAKLLSYLPRDLLAVIGIVIHRWPRSQQSWAPLVGRYTHLCVDEPEQGARMEYGHVYVAPADRHMTFSDDHVILDAGPKQHHTRPAIDRLFASAAQAYGFRVLGIVMTGGGSDGTDGLRSIAAARGAALVQSPSEAVHAFMPRHALVYAHVTAALPIEKLAERILSGSRGEGVR